MKTSIKAIFVCLIFLLPKSSVWGQAQGSENKKQSNELNMRGGLPNFFAKALKGDSVKVAYLGGCITAQSGWRVYSLNWFNQRFPKAKFSEINAAIGGTGSNFGVFRLHEHVLKFKPDLIFVKGSGFGKPGGRNGVGEGQRNGMNRATLAARYNPAYELNERIKQPVPVRHKPGKGSDEAREANVPGYRGNAL